MVVHGGDPIRLGVGDLGRLLAAVLAGHLDDEAERLGFAVVDPDDEDDTEKWYLETWDTKPDLGDIPRNCPLIARYRDRLVLAAGINGEHLFYMSRIGDPYDFDYGEGQPGSAIAGAPTKAGTLGEPIRALAPWRDDYLLFGCTNSLWVMRGDLGFGGQLEHFGT